MFALLAENFLGKWPLWLSPRQVAIIPVNDRARSYGEHVVKRAFRAAGIQASVDASERKVEKRVREAQVERQTNYILVVGQRESEEGSVSVRCRDDNAVWRSVPLGTAVAKIKEEAASRCRRCMFSTA